MCLVSKQKELKIADHDIECYKIVEDDGFGKLRSPYQGTIIDEEVVNGSKPYEAKETEAKAECDNKINNYIWSAGLVHAYKSILDCVSESIRIMILNSRRTGIYKCIIPKGTEYVIGIYSDIAARKIQFVELVKRPL